MTESNRSDEHSPDFVVPLDQQPADQQPLPPRSTDRADAAADDVSAGPRLPGVPQLPMGTMDGPAMPSRPSGPPLIPPLETTSPIDFVDTAGAAPIGRSSARPVTQLPDVDPAEFEPLRVDSPPMLVATWWLRSAVLLSMLAAIGLTMWTEYQSDPGDIATSPAVRGIHALSLVLIVLWSFLAMSNAGRIVPPSLYKKRSSGVIAVVLWALAVAAPIGAFAVWRRIEDRLSDPDDLAAVAVMVGVVLLTFLLIWLPFRYHARQAVRVGAPHRAMLGWFFAPILAAVGGLLAVAIGLGDLLAEDGLQTSERMLQVTIAYAMPMFVFALSTWRAITVFDEVVDLRWRRWRTEWEQTLGDLAALPAPGPEDSPSIGNVLDS